MTDLTAIAIEDARAHHTARLELIQFTDQQAMNLLSLYVTLSIAAASGFGASLGSALVPAAAGYALLTAAIPLLAGAACCFKVLSSADIALPGREPAFWRWATENDALTGADVLKAYLGQMAETAEVNRGVNRRGTWWLSTARACGVTAPVLASSVALAAWRYGL